MSEGASPKSARVLRPAEVSISDPVCSNPTEMEATLSVVITILRTDEELVENVEVLLNGGTSASMPVERAGSPTTPGAGLKQHTYDWSETVFCGEEHRVQARATITLTTHPASTEKKKTCECSPEPQP